MEDRLVKIRAEVERLIGDYNIKTEKYRGMNEQAHQYYGGKRDALSEILKSMVSMQEGSVSEDKDKITYQGKEYIRCYHDELDEFANKYPKTVPPPEKRYAKYSDVDMVIAVKAGANWQEQQMMKDAVDGTFSTGEFADGTPIDAIFNFDKVVGNKYEEGEKVKLIVIKN